MTGEAVGGFTCSHCKAVVTPDASGTCPHCHQAPVAATATPSVPPRKPTFTRIPDVEVPEEKRLPMGRVASLVLLVVAGVGVQQHQANKRARTQTPAAVAVVEAVVASETAQPVDVGYDLDAEGVGLTLRLPKDCFYAPSMDIKTKEFEKGVRARGGVFACGTTLDEWTSLLLVLNLEMGSHGDEFPEGAPFDAFVDRRLRDFVGGLDNAVTAARVGRCESVNLNGTRYRRCTGVFTRGRRSGSFLGTGWRKGNNALFAVLMHHESEAWGRERLGAALASVKLGN